jgi:hypothetical protein
MGSRKGQADRQRYRGRQIDGAVLPKLTVDDLKDLGVATVGDRGKLLVAIAELAAPSRRRSLARRAVRPSGPNP